MALGAHPLPPFLRQCSVLRVFKVTATRNSYTEQRNVEREVDRTTGIELATLQLRRQRTNRLSYVCCDCHENTDLHQANEASCCRERKLAIFV